MDERGLALFHLHQRDAGLDARERAAQALEQRPLARERFALSSCHRVEVYGLAVEAVDGNLAMLFPSVLRGDEAVARHLFRLACGLDSVVVGERQVLGQLRRAHDAARLGSALHGDLSELVRRALHIGRRVRALGMLPSGGSLGSLAVEKIVSGLTAPRNAAVLIIGAGEIGALAARALRARVARVTVANRDRERAQALASRIGADVADLADLDRALTGVDAVISAADTRGAVLTRERLARRLDRGALLLIDVAVPRSVADDARTLAGLRYLTVDDLQDLPTPTANVAAVERICDREAAAYVVWRRERQAGPAIRALRERGESIRRARVRRALAKLHHLDDRDRRIVEGLAAAIVNDLLHQPTLALRREPHRTAAALELFGGEG